MKQFCSGQGHETVKYEGQEVKGQGPRRLKLELEAWHRHRSWPLWVEQLV